MRVVHSLPHDVLEIENVFIPLADGCRLAARIWLPACAERDPVPAILEYIPYRKRDGTRPRDEPMHRYFAGHGYAAVRVDLRGSGDSDGLLLDEYLPIEQEDGRQVLAWIAAQPWCSGAVGMIGKSWGGFAALQIAALRPPSLAAVIAVCATDDRYADDAHWMGGCLLNENLIWGSILLAFNSLPPDPELVGDRWRTMWRDRLERTPLFPAVWLRHPRRDAYWSHGSVCEDFSRIAVPALLVSGWADGYTNAVPRLLAGLTVPRLGIIGPWAHVYPHDGVPGPPIGFLQVALRFFDRWLKGEANGIDGEPMLRAWIEEWVPPPATLAARPGRFVAEPVWPSAAIRSLRLHLAPGRLTGAPAAAGTAAVVVRSSLQTGLDAGAWCGFGVAGGAPGDQAEDDARSVCFDGAPLDQRLEVLGAPEVTLVVTADRPVALVVVRLCDVAPDGSSLRVSYGLLNLTHRDGHERPEPLPVGRSVTVRVRLNDCGHAFAAAHRIRLAVATSYWPLAWPAPEPVRLTVTPAGSVLDLPERPPRPEDDLVEPFPPPEKAPGARVVDLHPGNLIRRTYVDPASGETVVESVLDVAPGGGPALTRLDDIELVHGHSVVERFRIRDGDPTSAVAEVDQTIVMTRGAWSTRVRVTTRLDSTRGAFRLQASIRATEGEAPFFARDWDETVPRDLV